MACRSIDDFSWDTLLSKRIRVFSFWVLSRLSLSRVLIGSDCGAFLSFNLSANWCWGTRFNFWGVCVLCSLEKCLVFVTRFEELEFSFWRVLFLLAVLFSLFY